MTPDEPLTEPGAWWARSSLGEMGPSGTRGELSDAADADAGRANPTPPASPSLRASWDLRWEPRAGEVAYLPARWLYYRRVPRSNGAALVPAASATGTLVLDGDTVTIDGWEAMVGHNWGSEHAHQWCWTHAGRLGEDGRGWLDLVLVRIRIGPLVTPWSRAVDNCSVADARVVLETTGGTRSLTVAGVARAAHPRPRRVHRVGPVSL